ncbi:hypothetical protein DYBT9623_01603 [Dyadobacter sp. CECT 9623]|uniref:RHS repeat-associated core domain-containing protein n=1 Tax=Dyadobacter linearis TaxID=2823330 RepID=A0ABM8UN72_9BACT|nr:DUF6443 domain-containing protein [Dyadobacter sp. CECT 9623]CAG5068871.1 hypothetical protein DYBT9623_01603 [Dyadobacter sp. CECT 9623]
MKKLLLLFVFCVNQLFAQPTSTQNYILTRTYKQTGAAAGDVSKVSTQVQYFDGLGRPVQTVDVGQSPSGSDLIGGSSYDVLGRLSQKHLPYPAAGSGSFQPNAANSSASFYQSAPAGLDASDLGKPYQQTFYEKSPLGRVTGQQAPGNKSAASVIKHKVNAANQVKRYDFDLSNNTLSQAGHYAAGSLSWINETDEAGNVTNTFTDKLGQIVCEQIVASAQQTLSTYYVYDDLGLLRAVLQPGYQDNPSLSEQAFTYSYDERGRNISKTIPSAGTTELVYDRFNRPALSRNAGQAARGVWGFTKYDGRNRPIATGEVASDQSRADWSAAVDVNTLHHEERSNGQIAGYTLDKTAPKTATEANLLNITFYDDYAFSKAANLAYSSVYYPANNANVKGYPTGTRARVLPAAGGTGAWLTTVNYYDAEYRPLQTNRELYGLAAGAIERVSSQYLYDLAPVISAQKTEQILGGNNTNTHVATYTYDHADRLLSTHETVSAPTGSHEAYTTAQRYNPLGKLYTKWLQSKDGNYFLRKTTYTQNIRSWQTSAKTVYKKQNDGPELAFFGYGLAYLKGNSYTNGNISQMDWQDKTLPAKGLSFTYDGASRLTASTGINGYTDTEQSITYDPNGNLKTLTRAGSAQDQLVYAYSGNRLTSVTDNSASNTGIKAGLSSYAYDANGNMTTDGGRNATITYNQLDLAKTVKIGAKTFTYDYDASGRKLQYVADTITLQYAGIFEYRKVGNVSSLYRVQLAAGEAALIAGKPVFHYALKDHLGSTRLVFDEKGSTLQRTDYYPFGLCINRDGAVPKVQDWANRYLYNGKERQVGAGYVDYGARMYMPEIGRWGTTDPMSEVARRFSPYTYGNDNPLIFIDPDGMQSWHFEGKAAEEMFRQEQREQEDREKKRAEKDKPFGLLARMKATGWEPGQQLPVVDGIEVDHTIDFTIIPIAKPLEWLFKPLVGLVRAQWLGRVGAKEGTQSAQYTFTKSAGKHLTETVSRGANKGQLARPYMNSPLIIQEIMSTGKGIPDAYFKGGVNWKVPGTFNGSKGFYELGINPTTNVIYHFNYVH